MKLSPSVILSGLPLPPSHNDVYMIRSGMIRGRWKAWKAPTKELEQYEEAMQEWRLKNLGLANLARRTLVAELTEYQAKIRVDRFFAFTQDRIFTLADKPKRLDASNRNKPLDDALAKHILGLDDCWFFSGSEEKVTCSRKSDEQAIVVLTPMTPRRLDQILHQEEGQAPSILRQLRAGFPVASVDLNRGQAGR